MWRVPFRGFLLHSGQITVRDVTLVTISLVGSLPSIRCVTRDTWKSVKRTNQICGLRATSEVETFPFFLFFRPGRFVTHELSRDPYKSYMRTSFEPLLDSQSPLRRGSRSAWFFGLSWTKGPWEGAGVTFFGPSRPKEGEKGNVSTRYQGRVSSDLRVNNPYFCLGPTTDVVL